MHSGRAAQRRETKLEQGAAAREGSNLPTAADNEQPLVRRAGDSKVQTVAAPQCFTAATPCPLHWAAADGGAVERAKKLARKWRAYSNSQSQHHSNPLQSSSTTTAAQVPRAKTPPNTACIPSAGIHVLAMQQTLAAVVFHVASNVTFHAQWHTLLPGIASQCQHPASYTSPPGCWHVGTWPQASRQHCG